MIGKMAAFFIESPSLPDAAGKEIVTPLAYRAFAPEMQARAAINRKN
jgi:hypothetical protein